MANLANLVGFTTTTTGTATTLVVVAAIQGLRTPAGAGLADGVWNYGIETGAPGSEQYEVGTITIGSSGTSITGRTLVNSTTGSLLNLTGTSKVYITDLAADHENGNIPTAAISDGATTPDPGSASLRYSTTTFRLMAFFGGVWRSIASLLQANTWAAAQGGGPVALTPSSSITIDASAGNFFTLAPNANFGFANPTGLVSGRVQSFAVRIVQPASGGPRVISSWGSVFRYPGGISAVPALSTAANAVDYAYFTAWSPTEIEIVGIRKDVKA